MNKDELLKNWIAEQEITQIKGWDFSHIAGRFASDDSLPWDYKEEILSCLKAEHKILDLDTGGGEFLLSLGHPYENTAATENFVPNVAFCKNKLLPLGIDFKQADAAGKLPYADKSFDLVLDRHGAYNAREIFRVLKNGGLFITQQVGAENDRELVNAVMPAALPLPFPEQYLDIAVKKFSDAGFKVLKGEEAFTPIRFYDIGALVWFARIIEWEFVGFEVANSLEQLFALQNELEQNGFIEGRTHRFFLIAQKQA